MYVRIWGYTIKKFIEMRLSFDKTGKLLYIKKLVGIGPPVLLCRELQGESNPLLN